MAKPADMQCKALLGGATKKTSTPDRCPYQRCRITGQPGAWSVYCKGHRAEMQRMKTAGEVAGPSDDRVAPVAIRKTQTQREPWDNAGAWKRGDPI